VFAQARAGELISDANRIKNSASRVIVVAGCITWCVRARSSCHPLAYRVSEMHLLAHIIRARHTFAALQSASTPSHDQPLCIFKRGEMFVLGILL
jgi:hypothetical protein